LFTADNASWNWCNNTSILASVVTLREIDDKKILLYDKRGRWMTSQSQTWEDVILSISACKCYMQEHKTSICELNKHEQK
jgi:hypothetical protein